MESSFLFLREKMDKECAKNCQMTIFYYTILAQKRQADGKMGRSMRGDEKGKV